MNVAAHPVLELKDPAGTVHQVEYRQYTLNDHRQFAVLAIDRNVSPVDADPLGKLSEQGSIFRHQIYNSLRIDHWDFAKSVNPEILLITRVLN